MAVVVWVVEGTWPACVDAATAYVGDRALTLVHVVPAEVEEAAAGALAGLMGRGRRRPAPPSGPSLSAEGSAALLAAAAERSGGSPALVQRSGRVEREVVAAAEGADLLVVARDGDRSRLGPHSLGHHTRFVVDHAPCPVLLVWPGETPAVADIPPPPPPGHHPPHRPHPPCPPHPPH